MDNKTGQYVVYKLEICRIGNIVKKCFDGVSEKEYYTLYPINTKNTYYVPTNMFWSVARPVMTQKQLLDIIDRISVTKAEWTADRNSRKRDFCNAIKRADYDRIIPLMNGIYNEKVQREKNGKQLFYDDKHNFELAQKLLHSEIAFCFGIEIEKADLFIKDRIRANG